MKCEWTLQAGSIGQLDVNVITARDELHTLVSENRRQRVANVKQKEIFI